VRPQLPGPWIVTEQAPPDCAPLEEIRLFAILGAWMEGDVVEANVKNAMLQGCERVFLVDNDSSDDTVAAAVAAGAELADVFSTDEYDETLRLDIMNRVVHDVSVGEGSEHIWWLWLDADEFPHGPAGSTVREHLERLDRRFRIVGARYFNHYPDRALAYRPGFHPLDFQPLCEEHRLRTCRELHRKHPLQRFDRDRPRIVCGRGFHAAASEERPLKEPAEPIFLHHFPYRDEQLTRRRLDMLCRADASGATRARDGDDASEGILLRYRTLDAVYAGDWDAVAENRLAGDFGPDHPIPWEQAVDPEDVETARWYPTERSLRAAAPETPRSAAE
jgi:hypothetical protein